MPAISHILETCLYARDLAAMEGFYTHVLGLERMGAEYPRHVFFRVNAQNVLLIFNPAETVRKQDVPSHGAHGPAHVAFATTPADLNIWRGHLAEHGVDIEQEINWPNGARSIYFRDPAGNSIEIVTGGIWG